MLLALGEAVEVLFEVVRMLGLPRQGMMPRKKEALRAGGLEDAGVAWIDSTSDADIFPPPSCFLKTSFGSRV